MRIHANGAESSSAAGALTISPSSSNPYVSQLYDDSNSLSQCILDAYCDATGFENRGVTYADNMTGINWSTIPVTIVEMGFMTNESERSENERSGFSGHNGIRKSLMGLMHILRKNNLDLLP